jgi:iron complex outermembrane receptor protein
MWNRIFNLHHDKQPSDDNKSNHGGYVTPYNTHPTVISTFHVSIALLATLSCHGVSMAAGSDLLTLDLEDLSQVPILDSSATLTETDPALIPASITIITHEDILRSGARDLDELLEIYVPGLAYMYKAQGNQLGMRGIISDRNNKILLNLNGRNMNIEGSDGGAVSERWFSTLGDIRQITVVDGPGSAVYGPGAITGVINIETFDGNSFQGTETTWAAGAGEEFIMAEVRHGLKLNDEFGLFLYFGADKYNGAENAPHKVAYDLINQPWNHGNNILIEADKDFPFPTTADHGSFQDMARYKFHAQLDGENFSAWTRYTRSGLAIPTFQNFYWNANLDDVRNTGAANQQWTFFGRYTQDINDRLRIDYTLSYLLSDMAVEIGTGAGYRSWREDDTTLRIIGHYTPNQNHSLALGTEYVYNTFGKKGRLANTHQSTEWGKDIIIDPDQESRIGILPANTYWYSHMLSFFGEYQWHMNEQWTAFAGMRMDRHRFTPWMFSPRVALIYQPDMSHAWKFNYDHSVRHADDADLYMQRKLYDNDGDIEKIDHFELIHTHQISEDLDVEIAAYYKQHDVVAYNESKRLSEYIGTLNLWGLEAQLHYSTKNFNLALSHSYAKQLDFDIISGLSVQNISASPYGYGHDLANWHNNISKFRFDYHLTDRLEWTNSLRIYWGMPGAIDMADYNLDHGRSQKLPIHDDSTRAFEESLFLNTGLIYKAGNRLSLGFHAYNLLGLIDDDYNKRNYFQRTSHYRDTEPSVALSINYRFE